MDWLTVWIIGVCAEVSAVLLIISYAITKIILFHVEQKRKGGKNENERSGAKKR